MSFRHFAVVAAVVVSGGLFQLTACAAGLGAAYPNPEVTPIPVSTPTVTVTALPQKTLPHPKKQATSQIPKGSALYAALRLPESDGVPSGRYVRGKFGVTWSDIDKNGCDQRNDVLRRDLRKRHTKPGTRGCVLARGVLVSPYSGDHIKWAKGQTSIQIDHIVSLHDAWDHGMAEATQEDRRRFANDPLNLVAVDSDENQEKSDKTVDEYAPTWEPSVRCQFARRQVSIKAKYHLSVSAAEKQEFLTILGGSNYCYGDKLDLVRSKDARVKFPAPRPIGEPTSRPTPMPRDTTDPRYDTCAEAKAHGYGPYSRGDREYEWYRDQDKDGLTCE